MWIVNKAAVRGRAHVKEHIPCQDKVGAYCKEETYAVALADGAGSARFSHKGATVFVQTITRLLVERFDYIYEHPNHRNTKLLILRTLLKRLQELVDEKGETIRHYAATLLAVAVQGKRSLVLHIGDGVIGAWDGTNVFPISLPTNGEFVNTTVFVTTKNAVDFLRIQCFSSNRIKGWTLMSDGAASGLFLKSKQEFSTSLGYLFRSSCYLSSKLFTQSLKADMRHVLMRKTSDDCSIILLTNTNKYHRLSIQKKLLFRGIEPSSKILSIIRLLKKPCTFSELQGRLHLSSSTSRKYLHKLLQEGLIEKSGRGYKSIL